VNAPLARTVTPAQAGQKLIQYLKRAAGADVPGSVFMRWIRTGQVRVDGRRAKPFDRLEEGQSVRLPPFAVTSALRDAPKDEGQGAPVEIDIAAETDSWLVIAKPAGLPVHPGSGWADSVQTRINAAYADAPFIPVIVHRLDRDTSGLLLAAKTHRALTSAHEAFKRGLAVKEYLCWARGFWELSALKQPVELCDLLEKSGARGQEKMHAGSGRQARLTATPLVIESGRTLLRIRLHTGRTHQIRAQLCSRHHPVIGDAKYGGGKPPMYLHAWRLALFEERFEALPPWTGTFAVNAL